MCQDDYWTLDYDIYLFTWSCGCGFICQHLYFLLFLQLSQIQSVLVSIVKIRFLISISYFIYFVIGIRFFFLIRVEVINLNNDCLYICYLFVYTFLPNLSDMVTWPTRCVMDPGHSYSKKKPDIFPTYWTIKLTYLPLWFG